MAGSNFPNGFAAGVTIRGIPLQQAHPGEVFWVNNSSVLAKGGAGGSDGNDGSYRRPFSTLDFAVGKCTASRGDIIMIMPGHAETIATAGALALDVAGIAIIGLGVGTARPTFTWSVATATATLAASNISLANMIFKGNAASTFVAAMFVNTNAVVANDVTIDNCEFTDGSATLGFIAGVTLGTTAAQADGFTFTNNKVFRLLTSPPGASSAVVGGAAYSRITFDNNFLVNTTANNNVALGIAFGANVQIDLSIQGNRSASQNTGTTAGELFSGGGTESRGLVAGNYSSHLASTGLIGPINTKLGWAENYCQITGAADKNATINPLLV